MTAEGFERLEELFDAARRLPLPEREVYLREACGDDDATRSRVQRLLAHDEESGDSFLEGQAGWAWESAPQAPEQVGPYRIKRLIAVGGMGQVYLAVQAHPRRSVALKVMRAGVASGSALKRFEYESQVLARLRHPGIAQVYDAGTHTNGEGPVPYFAMEYVPGAKAITEYAHDNHLTIRERLELFTRVCDAVHHGHQKGIIHRDLKPGNILVDSSGQPKVIDFGVARATDLDLAVTTLQTDVGQLIGTLQYMSPEQCAGDPDDLDTRSDVYALGVVLYELLCRRLPYDVTKVAVHEAARVIRESMPDRPSATDRLLRGDLETITLKALEKPRQRRYQSAAELAADIARFLHNEPITARPASVAYQLRMMARRHRTLFHLVVVVALGLVMTVIGTSWGLAAARRAEAQALTERDIAQAERDRADRLFRSGHALARAAMDDFYKEVVPLAGTLPARQMIVEEALEYLEAIEADAGDDVDLQVEVAWAHRRIGQMIGGVRDPSLNRPGEALEHYAKALAINEAIRVEAAEHGENLRGLVAGHIYYGDALYDLRRRAEAGEHFKAALALSEQLWAGEPASSENRRLVSIAELHVGDVLRVTEGAAAAEPHYVRSLELAEARLREEGEHDEAVHDVTVRHGRMGELLRMKGEALAEAGDATGAMEQFGAARAHYEWMLRERMRLAAENPYSTRRLRQEMEAHLLLSPLLNAMGEADATIAHLGVAMEIAERLLYCDSRDNRTRKRLASTRRLYAYALLNAGATDAGTAQINAALEEYGVLASEFPDDVQVREAIEQIRDIKAKLEPGAEEAP